MEKIRAARKKEGRASAKKEEAVIATVKATPGHFFFAQIGRSSNYPTPFLLTVRKKNEKNTRNQKNETKVSIHFRGRFCF